MQGWRKGSAVNLPILKWGSKMPEEKLEICNKVNSSQEVYVILPNL